MRLSFKSFVLGALITAGFAAFNPGWAGDTMVYAAASLKDGLDACARKFSSHHGGSVKISYAASSILARQIEAGAPADIFISADQRWMDEVQAKGLIIKASRVDLLGNNLVLVAPRASRIKISLVPGVDLGKFLGSGLLAIGDPDYVPAGIYAKAALQSLGAWAGVKDRLVRAENVRAALALASRGEVPLAIVYGSDAVADKSVVQVAEFPQDSHPPITYPAALVKAGRSSGARAFLDYLQGPEAAVIFRNHGFSLK